jgi:hypothetical protein
MLKKSSPSYTKEQGWQFGKHALSTMDLMFFLVRHGLSQHVCSDAH